MTRIAVGAFLHETNTFAPTKADYQAFVDGGGWPPMMRGRDTIERTRNVNLGLSGFIEEAESSDWDIVPTIWAAASPSAHVEKDAFERIASELVEGIAAAGSIDAVYLDLHGAMVAEHVDDGEGEILSRVREVIGPSLPLVVSLDLHANISQLMVEKADVLIVYRTYPHIDMAKTGKAAARHLALLLRGMKFAKAFRQLPFLIPTIWQCTNDEPCKSIYADLAKLQNDAVPSLSFAPGFPAADFPDCAPCVIAYGHTQAAADEAADRVAARVLAAESDFHGDVFTPEAGVQHAIALVAAGMRPVVIADTQDNPGAGGDSDTTGMLRALVAADAQNAAIGLMVDPESARLAHQAGEGASIRLALGGKSGILDDAPFEGEFIVEKLSDGRFIAPGPYFGGTELNLGLSACLRIGGVRVVVGSLKVQLADQEMYRFVGVEPTQQSILVNKSSVHFRADFEPIAGALMICLAPGAMPADPGILPWRNLRPGIRIRPNGPEFSQQTQDA